jgi:hypothetical protein
MWIYMCSKKKLLKRILEKKVNAYLCCAADGVRTALYCTQVCLDISQKSHPCWYNLKILTIHADCWLLFILTEFIILNAYLLSQTILNKNNWRESKYIPWQCNLWCESCLRLESGFGLYIWQACDAAHYIVSHWSIFFVALPLLVNYIQPHLEVVTAQLQCNLTQLNTKLVLQCYWCVIHPTHPTPPPQTSTQPRKHTSGMW